MKTKVFCITAKDEFELVRKMNEDKREFVASQIFPKGNGWVAFCYYKDERR